MRIGDVEITQGRSAPHAQETRKSGRKAGAATTIPENKETAALNAYEEYQRLAFEAFYLGYSLDHPLPRPDDIGPMPTEDGVRLRRLRAERWAIERILKRREVERDE